MRDRFNEYFQSKAHSAGAHLHCGCFAVNCVNVVGDARNGDGVEGKSKMRQMTWSLSEVQKAENRKLCIVFSCGLGS